MQPSTFETTKPPTLTLEESKERAALLALIAAGEPLSPSARTRFAALDAKVTATLPPQIHPFRAQLDERDVASPTLIITHQVELPLVHAPGAIIDGAERRLSSPVSWVTPAELDAWSKAHEAKLAPGWAAVVAKAEHDQKYVTDPDARDAAVIATLAREQPRYRAQRTCWAAVQGDDCWEVRKVGAAAGWRFTTETNRFADNFLRPELQRIADARLLFRWYLTEQARALAEHQAAAARWTDASVPLTPLARLLHETAVQVCNRRGGVLSDVEAWWERVRAKQEHDAQKDEAAQ